jgi:hypothetical protein
VAGPPGEVKVGLFPYLKSRVSPGAQKLLLRKEMSRETMGWSHGASGRCQSSCPEGLIYLDISSWRSRNPALG